MAKLVATLGTSPGGIVETFLHLRESDSSLNDIVVITTSDPSTRKAYDILLNIFQCCVKVNYPQVMLSKIEMPFQDITSSEDLEEFYNKIKGVINEGDYVDITGGRKAMSAVAAMAAAKKGARVFTTIIPQSDYTIINNKVKELEDKVIEKCDEALKGIYCSLISKNARTIELTIR
ncbi:MAG: CRISPR-associated ring nuclease Crn1 [Sulfolobaceae archaeon]|nr:CRISPR-associated ring nuclease Crn1 [Sulfolobaceae archaeon]